MSARAPWGALAIARAWVALYTLGTSPDARARRRAEIASDLWESVQGEEPTGGLGLLRRVGGGALDDLAWAIETHGIDERIKIMSLALRQLGITRVIATIALGCMLVALVASMIGGGGAAATVVLGALGIIGFTGLALSLTDSADARGADNGPTSGGDIVNAQLAATRQKRLLTLLLVSVALIAVTGAYAFTRDEWGDTGAIVIVGMLPLCLIVGVGALTVLIADALKASRRS